MKKISKSYWPLESKSREEKYSVTMLGLIIVAVFSLFIFFLLIPSCQRTSELQPTVKARQAVIDSLAYDTQKVMEDSKLSQSKKIQYLGNQVIFLEQHYGNILNDLRQETNNHIEYINTWLGVWIAILALVCGVAPAVLQYRLYIINRRKLREELEIFEQTIGCHEINNYVSSVLQCLDSQIIADSPDSRTLISILLNKTTDSFDKLLNILNKEDRLMIMPSQINALTLSLVQLSGMLDRIKARVDERCGRSLQKVNNKIKNTIRRLTGIDQEGSSDLIFRDLLTVLNDLRTLNIEWDFVED